MKPTKQKNSNRFNKKNINPDRYHSVNLLAPIEAVKIMVQQAYLLGLERKFDDSITDRLEAPLAELIKFFSSPNFMPKPTLANIELMLSNLYALGLSFLLFQEYEAAIKLFCQGQELNELISKNLHLQESVRYGDLRDTVNAKKINRNDGILENLIAVSFCCFKLNDIASAETLLKEQGKIILKEYMSNNKQGKQMYALGKKTVVLAYKAALALLYINKKEYKRAQSKIEETYKSIVPENILAKMIVLQAISDLANTYYRNGDLLKTIYAYDLELKFHAKLNELDTSEDPKMKILSKLIERHKKTLYEEKIKQLKTIIAGLAFSDHEFKEIEADYAISFTVQKYVYLRFFKAELLAGNIKFILNNQDIIIQDFFNSDIDILNKAIHNIAQKIQANQQESYISESYKVPYAATFQPAAEPSPKESVKQSPVARLRRHEENERNRQLQKEAPPKKEDALANSAKTKEEIQHHKFKWKNDGNYPEFDQAQALQGKSAYSIMPHRDIPSVKYCLYFDPSLRKDLKANSQEEQFIEVIKKTSKNQVIQTGGEFFKLKVRGTGGNKGIRAYGEVAETIEVGEEKFKRVDFNFIEYKHK